MEWQPIETAPKDGRQLILLKTPYSPDGTPAYSNTWWTCGFSVECTPTHWKLAHNAKVSGAGTASAGLPGCAAKVGAGDTPRKGCSE